MEALQRELLQRLPQGDFAERIAEVKQGLTRRNLVYDLRELEALERHAGRRQDGRIIDDFRSAGCVDSKFQCIQPGVRKFVYIMADALGYYHRHVDRDDAPHGWTLPYSYGGDFTPGCSVCEARKYEYRKPVGVELSTKPLALYKRSQRHAAWAAMRNAEALREERKAGTWPK